MKAVSVTRVRVPSSPLTIDYQIHPYYDRFIEEAVVIITITCAWCGEESEKPTGEINRQLKKGRTYFFCNNSCGAQYRNEHGGKKNRSLEKKCPECGELFMSHTGAKAATFCSRSCASAGSVTEYRSAKAREVMEKLPKADIYHTSKMMRQREAWRYVKVNTYLNHINVPHEFEYIVGNYLFDLALTEHGVLIEFDEQYHTGAVQLTKDNEKDRYAESQKWIVVRVPARASTVIDPESIYHIIESFVLS